MIKLKLNNEYLLNWDNSIKLFNTVEEAKEFINRIIYVDNSVSWGDFTVEEVEA